MSNPNPFTKPIATTATKLEQIDGFSNKAYHQWRQSEWDALAYAIAAQRPLLVRGEAGCGKSQLARAAASHLETRLFKETVHPRLEPMDLLYSIDQIKRLADAHSGIVKDEDSYLKEGCLTLAFRYSNNEHRPVVLIDEIDKADADIPNTLLDVLANRNIKLPGSSAPLEVNDRNKFPLVIITTNEDRELPAAFVRRCAVLSLDPPKIETDFIAWLIERAKAHESLVQAIDPTVFITAARQVTADRTEAKKFSLGSVGLAEYLDLLFAIVEITASATSKQKTAEQLKWLDKLSRYALVKGRDQDQTRSPNAYKDSI